jgi:small subunit ribosomal protein S12
VFRLLTCTSYVTCEEGGGLLSHDRAASRTFVHRQQVNDHTTAAMPVQFLRRLVRPSIFAQSPLTVARPSIAATPLHNAFAGLSLGPTPASRANKCTLIQVLRQGRIAQRARKLRSPQLANRPELKGVCLKVGTTKPKKPNSGERKIARVRLSTGKVITAYIPGEGTLQVEKHGLENHGLTRRQVTTCSSIRLLWYEVGARRIVLE